MVRTTIVTGNGGSALLSGRVRVRRASRWSSTRRRARRRSSPQRRRRPPSRRRPPPATPTPTQAPAPSGPRRGRRTEHRRHRRDRVALAVGPGVPAGRDARWCPNATPPASSESTTVRSARSARCPGCRSAARVGCSAWRWPRRSHDDRFVYAYATTPGGNQVMRMTLVGGRLSAPAGAAGRHPRVEHPQRRTRRLRAGRHALCHHRRRRRHRAEPTSGVARRQDPAADPRRRRAAGQPRPHLARVLVRAPQRAGHRLGRRGQPVGQRVRCQHLGRAQPDRGRAPTTAGRASRGRVARTPDSPTRLFSGRPTRPAPAGSRSRTGRCSWLRCAGSGCGRCRSARDAPATRNRSSPTSSAGYGRWPRRRTARVAGHQQHRRAREPP